MSARKKAPGTSEAQRVAWQRWAAEHPEEAQANRNKYWQSEAGRAWLAANQARRNEARKAWRARKRAAGERPT